MDGTLIETETRWWRAEIDVMEKHGSTWTTDDQNQAIGGPLQAVVDYMSAKAKADAKSIYDELVNEMFNSFTNNPPKLQPGWSEVLDEAVQENLKIALVKNTYTVNLSTHEFLSSISEDSVAATTSLLTGKTTASGIFDADNITVENYGNSGFAYLVLYKDTGVRATSRLLAYIDTAAGLPMAATTDPISITINWSNDQYKIFTL
jgi:hypothetical protein